jgi:hypothetical protein
MQTSIIATRAQLVKILISSVFRQPCQSRSVTIYGRFARLIASTLAQGSAIKIRDYCGLVFVNLVPCAVAGSDLCK